MKKLEKKVLLKKKVLAEGDHDNLLFNLCTKLAAWLQWCLDNCDGSPEWNFGGNATQHMRNLLSGGDAPMPPDTD